MNAAAVKSVLARVVRRLGGVEQAAADTRLGKSRLAACYSHHAQHDGDHIPADAIIALEAALGEPAITAVLAQAAGHRLVPATARGAGELAAALAKVGQRSGEVFACAAAALADGHIDDRERAELVRQLAELELAAGQAAAVLAEGGQ